MGPIEELSGYWDNLNHPSIPVDDTAVAVIRFRSGGLGVVVASNAQRPGIGGQLHVHGSNGASVGTRTDAGSMFISGVTEAVEPAVNDLWTIDGEADLIVGLGGRGPSVRHGPRSDVVVPRAPDRGLPRRDPRGSTPAVDGDEGRKVVELFTAIYRSQRDHGRSRSRWTRRRTGTTSTGGHLAAATTGPAR